MASTHQQSCAGYQCDNECGKHAMLTMLFWCQIAMPHSFTALPPNSSMQGLIAYSVTSSSYSVVLLVCVNRAMPSI